MEQPKYSWGHNRRYNDYSSYIKKIFGCRVQKISVDVGFTCPNRDGSKGVGGCIYCDNNTFSPDYCSPKKTISKQLDSGVQFFDKKYPDMDYMAYFQSYTNTYAPIADLEKLYQEALEHPKIVGLIVGTRPDCINSDLLDMLLRVTKGKHLTIEFGLESTLNRTLDTINRCHTWEDSVAAIQLCKQKGIVVGGHIILGLPGEQYSNFIHHATELSKLPIQTLKLHQLQITKNTKLADIYRENPNVVSLFTLESYLNTVVDFLEHLNPEIVVERFVSTSPIDKLIAPCWNSMKNFEVVAKLEKALEQRNTWQGRLFTAV